MVLFNVVGGKIPPVMKEQLNDVSSACSDFRVLYIIYFVCDQCASCRYGGFSCQRINEERCGKNLRIYRLALIRCTNHKLLGVGVLRTIIRVSHAISACVVCLVRPSFCQWDIFNAYFQCYDRDCSFLCSCCEVCPFVWLFRALTIVLPLQPPSRRRVSPIFVMVLCLWACLHALCALACVWHVVKRMRYACSLHASVGVDFVKTAWKPSFDEEPLLCGSFFVCTKLEFRIGGSWYQFCLKDQALTSLRQRSAFG